MDSLSFVLSACTASFSAKNTSMLASARTASNLYSVVHQNRTICLLCHSVNIHAQSSAGKFHLKFLIHIVLLLSHTLLNINSSISIHFCVTGDAETTEKHTFSQKYTFQWSRICQSCPQSMILYHTCCNCATAFSLFLKSTSQFYS